MIYFYRLRRKVLITTRDLFGFKQSFNAPIISII
jgi:ABC-type multidrug transport system fused ATPase/permease subunit